MNISKFILIGVSFCSFILHTMDQQLKTLSIFNEFYEKYSKDMTSLIFTGLVICNDDISLLDQEICLKMKPSFRNALRRVKKSFAYHLSWDYIKPYMFSEDICATNKDIWSLYVISLYHKDSSTIKKKSSDLYKKFQTSYIDLFYDIEGTDQTIIRDPISKPNKFHGFSIVDCSVGDNFQKAHCILSFCMTRNSKLLAIVLKKLIESEEMELIDPHIMQTACHIASQNNDDLSLALLLPHHTAISYENINQLLQLALYKGYYKIISCLNERYQQTIKAIRMHSKVTLYNYIGKLINPINHNKIYNQPKYNSLRDIIKEFHTFLVNKHEECIKNYYISLNIIFSKKVLKKMDHNIFLLPHKELKALSLCRIKNKKIKNYITLPFC